MSNNPNCPVLKCVGITICSRSRKEAEQECPYLKKEQEKQGKTQKPAWSFPESEARIPGGQKGQSIESLIAPKMHVDNTKEDSMKVTFKPDKASTDSGKTSLGPTYLDLGITYRNII